MIDNFKTIEKFLQFEQGTFYKFELLVRNADGNNALYENGYSNTNKNILIKSWYVDNNEYLQKIKNEMITLANLTGARLYITLDRKDNVKLVKSLLHDFTDILCNLFTSSKPTIKSISKTFSSQTSKIENSCKNVRTIMFDVDTQEGDVLEALVCYIRSKEQVPYILTTKKGYHVFCFKKFDHSSWQQDTIQCFINTYTGTNIEVLQQLTHNVVTYVSVKQNELGLVYHPMKGE